MMLLINLECFIAQTNDEFDAATNAWKSSMTAWIRSKQHVLAKSLKTSGPVCDVTHQLDERSTIKNYFSMSTNKLKQIDVAADILSKNFCLNL